MLEITKGNIMTIHALRMELGDTDVTLPIMSDIEYRYFLDKNDWSIRRAALDAAKSILLKLSMRSDESVDIFSVKGTGTAKQYMQALQMYIKNPDLNQNLQNLLGYAGGISISDMQANNATSDNNIIIQPSTSPSLPTSFFGI
jgi:hypothetical protein